MREHLDRMTCEEAFRRLDDFVDRELTGEEMRLIHEHLTICNQCTREFTFEISVLAGLRTNLSRIAAPSYLLSRIVSALARADGQGA